MLALRFCRLNRGYTQTSVGHLANLSQTAISLIESGRLNPTPAELAALARVFGVSPPELLLKEMPEPSVVETATEQIA